MMDMNSDTYEFGRDLIAVVMKFARALPEALDAELVIEPSHEEAYELCITLRDEFRGESNFDRLATIANLFPEWEQELSEAETGVPTLYLCSP